MTKLKKTTSARIEDVLDIVAEKIIDLEKTAKQLEQLKRSIANEVSKAQSLSLKVNIEELKANQDNYMNDLKTLNTNYLKEIDKKNNTHRPLYYLIYFLIIICFILIYFLSRNM